MADTKNISVTELHDKGVSYILTGNYRPGLRAMIRSYLACEYRDDQKKIRDNITKVLQFLAQFYGNFKTYIIDNVCDVPGMTQGLKDYVTKTMQDTGPCPEKDPVARLHIYRAGSGITCLKDPDSSPNSVVRAAVSDLSVIIPDTTDIEFWGETPRDLKHPAMVATAPVSEPRKLPAEKPTFEKNNAAYLAMLRTKQKKLRHRRFRETIKLKYPKISRRKFPKLQQKSKNEIQKQR